MNELELYNKCLETIIVLNDGRLDDFELGTIYRVVKRMLSELSNPAHKDYMTTVWEDLYVSPNDLAYIHYIISEVKNTN